ncbi:MAG: hypothetical protein QM650_10645 [Microlunatus sp.]
MEVDFGASLVMLLHWLGSVALIIGGTAAAALLVDWLREVSRRRSLAGLAGVAGVDGTVGVDGRPVFVSIVREFDPGSGVGDSGSSESTKVSSLDAAPAGRSGPADSTGSRVA